MAHQGGRVRAHVPSHPHPADGADDDPDEYTTWAYEYWYGQVFKNDMPDAIDDTTFLVVDTCNTPTPAVGSMDSMIWAALGAHAAS